MKIKTFRAKTMQQALNLVRSELGPEATVLHTKELNSSLVARFLLGRQYEIAASLDVQAPTRLTSTESAPQGSPQAISDHRDRYRMDFCERTELQQDPCTDLEDLHSLAERIRQNNQSTAQCSLPDALFQAYTDLIEADIEEQVARELIDSLRSEPNLAGATPEELQAQLTRIVEGQLRVSGPIQTGTAPGRIVALVGPTGVGNWLQTSVCATTFA